MNQGRRLLDLLAALSLLLCVAAVALWVRSYWFADTLRWSGARVYSLGSHNGLLVWNDFRPDPGSPPLPGWQTYRGRDAGYARGGLGGSAWNRIGFVFAAGSTAGGNPIRQATVPHWFLALAAFAISAPMLRAVVRGRRHVSSGRCRRCGYDLRATPDRCPECGHVPAPATRIRP